MNQNTGTIQLAALFANPGNVLRPGQYGKVRAVMRVQQNALLIPQAAVTDQQGSYQVDVVGSDDRVAIRPVQVGERTGTMWVIQERLKAWRTRGRRRPAKPPAGNAGATQAIQGQRPVTAAG